MGGTPKRIEESLKNGLSDRQVMEWLVGFFNGTKPPTNNKAYNEAAGRGTGKLQRLRSGWLKSGKVMMLIQGSAGRKKKIVASKRLDRDI